MLGLYIHVPFCTQKCPYCDFATAPYLADRVPRYLDAVRSEAASYASAIHEPFTTVFFGGGTPSLLTGSQLAALVAQLRSAFDVAQNAETTLEANPET